jgi:di/tricarboxylate transporter
MLSGFANQGVLTVAALYPIAAGMYATGAISLLSQRLIGYPKTLRAAQWKILIPTSLGSAFLNNTPLVAMLIPVIRDLTRITGLDGTKLYMFVSFASILGGAATLIGTSTNLVIAGLVNDAIAAGTLADMRPLTIFQPTLVGGPAALAGLLFMIYVGSRLLATRRGKQAAPAPAASSRCYVCAFEVSPGSPLIGMTLKQAGLAGSADIRLTAITRAGGSAVLVDPATRLAAQDRLTFAAAPDAVPLLWTTPGLRAAFGAQINDSRARYALRLVEVAIAPGSTFVGKRVRDLPPPAGEGGVELVGLSRMGEQPQAELEEWRIEAGDNAIFAVEESFFYDNRAEANFGLMRRLRGFRVPRSDRAVAALVITLAMILLAAFDVMSMLNAALLAGLALLLTGALTPERAFRSIEWETIVVLGAAVGLAEPIAATGLSTVVADLLAAVGRISPVVALAAVFVGCIVMTNLITNAAAAAFMFPVALSLANGLGLHFMPFAVILMLGTSYAFVSPAGYQTNLMVQQPGGYTFTDFARAGLPLTITVGLLALGLTLVIYPF